MNSEDRFRPVVYGNAAPAPSSITTRTSWDNGPMPTPQQDFDNAVAMIMEPDGSAPTEAALTRARRRWGSAEVINCQRLG
jgi:hypothetical protein